MIFVTVGTQLPFPRLTGYIEHFLTEVKHAPEIFMQSADTRYSNSQIQHAPFLDAEQYDNLWERCDCVVSHAGMGTIIKALETEKAIIVVPRMYSLNEHRNNHQESTVSRLSESLNIQIAESELALTQILALGDYEKCRITRKKAIPETDLRLAIQEKLAVISGG